VRASSLARVVGEKKARGLWYIYRRYSGAEAMANVWYQRSIFLTDGIRARGWRGGRAQAKNLIPPVKLFDRRYEYRTTSPTPKCGRDFHKYAM
jgi:hypothetical protein